jgi:hypothetical protein
MDIFFIHGVNKRRELGHTFASAEGSGGDGDGFLRKYDAEISDMREWLRRCCREAGLPEPRLCPVYWGGHGARIHFYEREGSKCHALVQSAARRGRVEFKRKGRPLGVAAGASDPEQTRVAEELELIAGQLARESVTLVELLYAAPQAVIQTMLAPELDKHRADPAKRRAAGASVAVLARRVREDTALRAALEQAALVGDLALVELLQRELARSSGQRAQGVGTWTLTTMRRLASGTISSLLKSQSAYLDASRFFGDSVRYFAGRGTPAEPGPIVRDALSQIDAHLASSPRTGPTIFITHSLGGALFYDLFTYFVPELRFDLWVSVGSQLAYYEDVKLLARSTEATGAYFGREIEGVPRKVSAALPPGAAWYNLFDARDPIAFAAEEVFENVRDLQVRLTEGDIATVHTGYFNDAYFYEGLKQAFSERFGTRIQSEASSLFEMPVPSTGERA